MWNVTLKYILQVAKMTDAAKLEQEGTVFDGVYDDSVSNLSRAAAADDPEKIRALMKAAKHSLRGVDNRGWTAFHWAARHGGAAALEALACFAAQNDYKVIIFYICTRCP